MIDCHFHYDTTILTCEGLLASMEESGVGKVALIPSLIPPFRLPAYAKYLLPLVRKGIHRRGGLLRRIVTGVYKNSVRKDGQVDLLGKRYPVIADPSNDDVQRALEAEPEKLVGYVFVNPAGSIDPVREIESRMGMQGWIGVKAHPFWHDYPVKELCDCAALCEEKAWVMLLHLGMNEMGDFKVLPENFPRLKIIYAHTGIPYAQSICEYARSKENVYVDISSSAYVDLRAAEQAIRLAGPEKCLFGTDGPYFHVADDRFDFDYFKRRFAPLSLSDSEREKIDGENFTALIQDI